MSETVELNIELELHDASEQQLSMYREMANIFEDRFALFVEKNMDYGSSFLTAGEVDMALGGGNGPFDSAWEANLYKLFTRCQDKEQRFYQQAFANGQNHVGESVVETTGDNMVYWAMITWLLEQEDFQ